MAGMTDETSELSWTLIVAPAASALTVAAALCDIR